MASVRDRDADVGASEPVASTRRTFLLMAGAASCAALTHGTAQALSPKSKARRAAGQVAPSAAESHALMQMLPPGFELHTSKVAAVHPVKLGAVAVVMSRADGSVFQLDVLRRSEGDGAIAQSSGCSVFAVNGGTGASATSEPDGLAAMALARTLGSAEAAGMPALALLTHGERALRNPAGAFRVVR